MRRAESYLLTALALSLSGPGCDRSATVVKPNVPPKAQFNFNPVAPIYAGQTSVLFNATGSFDSDGQVSQYLWNFGDDNTTSQQDLGPNPRHVFTDTPATCVLKVYSVLLTVVDNAGGQDSVSQNVTVTELPVPGSLECK